MEELRYAVATENDIPFINETYNENVEKLHGVERQEDFWKGLLLGQSSTYYVVNAQGSVAWFRTDVEDGEFWLGMIQVHPKWYRQGVGKYILKVFEKIAKDRGYQRIGIHTTEDNLAARLLYLSAGYEVTEIGPCTTADGEERVGYTFQKEI